jgi:hypothetical protein
MTQKLKPTKENPIVIETPMGFIVIKKARRGVEIELPEGMVAHKGMDRAVETAKFCDLDEDGFARPKFSLLACERVKPGVIEMWAKPVYKVGS